MSEQEAGRADDSGTAGRSTWAEFFEFMESVDVPDDFMATRPLNVPPLDRNLFSEDD